MPGRLSAVLQVKVKSRKPPFHVSMMNCADLLATGCCETIITVYQCNLEADVGEDDRWTTLHQNHGDDFGRFFTASQFRKKYGKMGRVISHGLDCFFIIMRGCWWS